MSSSSVLRPPSIDAMVTVLLEAEAAAPALLRAADALLVLLKVEVDLVGVDVTTPVPLSSIAMTFLPRRAFTTVGDVSDVLLDS